MSGLLSRHWPNLVVLTGVVVFVAALVLSGRTERTQPDDPDEETFVPPVLAPADNAVSDAKIELGRYLFYERGLSFNGATACASCHQQERAFSDGLPRSVGATGEFTRRNAMSLTNVAYNSAFTWADSMVVSLEQQALIPLTSEHPLEMGIAGHEQQVLARLQADPAYRARFDAAVPDSRPAITLDHVVKALATFERTLLSHNAPYDRYLKGDSTAINASALRGRALFFSDRLQCSRCHGGHNFRFTLGHKSGPQDRSVAFHNTGLYNVDGAGAYPASDQGLIEVTGEPGDMGRYKTPTLRNVALSAPYMHDGSIATLEDVLAHYARGGRLIADGPSAGDGSRNPYKSELLGGFELSDEETADVIAFLRSLTDEDFIHNPLLADPAPGHTGPD